MGLETATLIALATSLGGAAVGAVNNRRTANKQDAVAAEGIRTQRKNQDAMNSRINRTLDQAQASSPEDTRAKASKQYMDVLQAKQAQARAGLRPQGISSTYDAEALAAQQSAAGAATDVAGLMSRIDAPMLQRQQEQFAYGNLGMDLDALGGNIQGDDFLNRMRLNAVRPNPYMEALGAGLSAYGSMAGSGAIGSDVARTPAYRVNRVKPTYTVGNVPQVIRRPRRGP